MKRIFKILCVAIFTLSIILITSCKANDKVDESFIENVNKLKSYKMQGVLENYFPSGTKECVVTTYYKSPDNYRVELLNPNSVEGQIMVKNASGVYVLIPSVNKTFKVNSTWPANSSYPYLLQSLANDIISDSNIISTNEDSDTILELKAKLFNKEEITQKIILSNKNDLKEVLHYNTNHDLISKFKVTSIEKDLELEDTLFDTSETLETLNVYYKENPLDYDRTINYPAYYPDNTSIKDELIVGSSNNKSAITTFSGSVSYTITQKFLNDDDASSCEYVNGYIYATSGMFFMVDDNNITFYNNGIQYTIASNEVDTLEMIKMGDSLESSDLK